jgi:hypothetical protein
VYEPATSDPTEAVTCNVAGAEPEAGDTVNQAESFDAVKLSVPPPAFVTETD